MIGELLERCRWLPRARSYVLIVFVALVVGCASPQRLPAVPAPDVVAAAPLGIANARFFPEEQRAELHAEFHRATQRQRKDLGLTPGAQLPAAEVLAISGGADNGAFGSGLLVGWSDHGDRPEFELVTGVSTGALLAPFAFLGPDYNRQLKAVYTTVSADDIFIERSFIAGILEDALTDTTPLFELISAYVDDAMVADISREYEKGRLLLIGTTDLDAQRPVLWNIGAIAASGQDGSVDLIRKILRASSAIPGVFQPVMIDVAVGGKSYQELHVDGGAIQQMFLYPPGFAPEEADHLQRTAYLIMNAREDPEWGDVDRRTLSIAGRAISTMIHYSGVNDLLRIYYTLRDDGIAYNLAYIGDDFVATEDGEFDRVYMNKLYNYAYQLAANGYPWRKAPPSLSRTVTGAVQ